MLSAGKYCTLLLALMFAACGGNSSGKNVRIISINGQLLNADGSAVQGALIETEESGERTTTGAEGSFSFLVSIRSRTLTIFVTIDDLNRSVTLDSIPTNAIAATMVLRISDPDGSIQVAKIHFAEESNSGCVDTCGDGVCAEIVCLATSCPCAEDILSCPSDCSLP